MPLARRGRCRRAARHAGRCSRTTSAARAVVPRPDGRPAGRRLPGRAGADRRGLGRDLRQGPDQRHAAASDLLPVQSTDFAFAVLLEELGFIGGIVVFLLFIGLIWRILLIGWRCESVFGVAFAGGVASMIVFQMLVNAGMVAGMMPVTGIPLPFITHGGASLMSIAIALGLMQSINIRETGEARAGPW